MCHTINMEISLSGGETVERKGKREREERKGKWRKEKRKGERKERKRKKEGPDGFGGEKRERKKERERRKGKVDRRATSSGLSAFQRSKFIWQRVKSIYSMRATLQEVGILPTLVSFPP